MQQGEMESNDNYIKRFKSNLDTLIVAGGRHILCSQEIADKAGATATEKEVLVEDKKFKAICYVKMGDPNRYGSLITDLEHRAHLGKDEYPEQLSTAFDVMVCRSGVITNTGRGGRG